MRALLDLMQGYLTRVPAEAPSRLQLTALRLIFAVCMVLTGISGGFVIAFVVYFLSDAGNALPAVYAFFATAALCSAFGVYTALFKMRPAPKKS